MLGIDGSEFLVIILVAIIVIGPKDMPKMLRGAGRAMAHLRGLAQQVRGRFDEALQQANMRDAVNNLRGINELDQDLNLRNILASSNNSLRDKAAKSGEKEDISPIARDNSSARSGEDKDTIYDCDIAARAEIEGRKAVALNIIKKTHDESNS